MEEKSAFVETFGNSVFVRVLDFLLTFSEFDYPIKQIAQEINAGWTGTEQVIGQLIQKGIVKETRELGKSKMYALNKENKLAQFLLKMDFELSTIAVEQELQKQAQISIKAITSTKTTS